MNEETIKQHTCKQHVGSKLRYGYKYNYFVEIEQCKEIEQYKEGGVVEPREASCIQARRFSMIQRVEYLE